MLAVTAVCLLELEGIGVGPAVRLFGLDWYWVGRSGSGAIVAAALDFVEGEASFVDIPAHFRKLLGGIGAELLGEGKSIVEMPYFLPGVGEEVTDEDDILGSLFSLEVGVAVSAICLMGMMVPPSTSGTAQLRLRGICFGGRS